MCHLELLEARQARKHTLSVLLVLALSVAAGAARTRSTPGELPQSPSGTIQGVVTVLDQQKEPSPLEGIRVELRGSSQDSQPLATLTDSAGHYEFTQLPAGTYTLRVNQQDFKPFAQAISLDATKSSVVDIPLALDTVVEKVEVKEQAANVSTENSSPASTINNAQLETLPLAQQKFREALPLVPGVIRTLDGKLSIRGASENQGMLQVDSAKTVDPVTGSFSIPVPIDAIQTVNVDKTPFSAENGGFSGGLTTIETTPPPSDWFYKVKDFNVSLRGKNGHFVGISQATPRVSFGGPIGDGKLTFSEVFEYDVRRDPVRGLAWPRNEIKSQGFNSFTRVQAILSSQQVFNADVNVFPMRTEFANITALVPQTASSDFNKTSEKGSGIVRHLVFDRLLQSEGETSAGREHHNSAITGANYTFALAGEEEVGPYHCFVLEATPKRKDKYLFEGKIWVEAQDFAVVKIVGHPAKQPSFWINRADFVRQYQRIDGFWLPYRDETSVEVKIYGRRIFTVDHQQYVINPATPLQADTGSGPDD